MKRVGINTYCAQNDIWYLRLPFDLPEACLQEVLNIHQEGFFVPHGGGGGSKFGNAPKIVGGVAVGMFALACAFGTKLGFEAHSPFLFGIGNLSQESVSSLPFGALHHSELYARFVILST